MACSLSCSHTSRNRAEIPCYACHLSNTQPADFVMHEWYLHPADVFLSRRVKTILESFDLHTESKSESDTARAMRRQSSSGFSLYDSYCLAAYEQYGR